MQVIGIIAEYNPFHSGHRHHIQKAREDVGGDCAVVCVMSGNYVQRGDVAITDKWNRSAMALSGGADLVLELPTPFAISSAEYFAGGAVDILIATGLVDTLSFGSETGDLSSLSAIAHCLEGPDYPPLLRQCLQQGQSFPAARQKAVEQLLGEEIATCLSAPNSTLGIEYLRALYRRGSSIQPSTILRQSVSHDAVMPHQGFASASYLREQLLHTAAPETLAPYLDAQHIAQILKQHPANLTYGTQGVFARLRSLSPGDFLLLPDCTEGLHHLLHRAAHETSSLPALYAFVKSRRYTHARIRRLVLWAFLGLTAANRPEAPLYLRVLAMNGRGKDLLRQMKQSATLPVLTKPAHIRKLDEAGQALFTLEARCTSLYPLCRADMTETLSEYSQNPVVLP